MGWKNDRAIKFIAARPNRVLRGRWGAAKNKGYAPPHFINNFYCKLLTQSI